MKAFQGDHHLTTEHLGRKGENPTSCERADEGCRIGARDDCLEYWKRVGNFSVKIHGGKTRTKWEEGPGRASLRCREESPNKYGHLPMSFMKTKHTTPSHYQHNVFEDPFISNKIGKRWILRTQNTLEGTY